MHAIFPILALASCALAQLSLTDAIKEIPACSIQCLSMGSAAATECGIADAYCQCTKGAPAIKIVTQKCLCEAAASGKCTADDLMKANKASSDICKAALAAKGETFSAPPAVDASACGGAVSSMAPTMMSSMMSLPMASSTSFSTTMATPIASAPSTMGPMPGVNMTTPPAAYGGTNTTMTNMTMTASTTMTASVTPSQTAKPTTSAPAQQTAGARSTAAGDSFAVLLSLGMLGMAAAGLVAM
ncbi:uncharacterized protein MYCFIDRAFT_87643 [Pseudocercospora fijiensis CIRAD86]|uniref:CFEM domain-containing protein n=1 Tax=Pseudocercospora fijiensis (strain CIRAD86) TaxID=383855 RepID=M2ZUP8_PSEFD|nr:uncharacterized protein MYCFIDRAFT_87643 [Pseudocercospora fijiensis CIRAD86]EME82729.1 hypothetical protein MYCFIDRAFT_87643 [Pseudocercospora fijiensis CIRAD86]